MVYLLGSILCSSAITLAMKYSESRNLNRYAVTVFNYLTGVIVSILMVAGASRAGVGSFTVFIGMGNGFFYVASLLFMQISIRKNGAPMTATFSRLGTLAPVLFAAAFLGEIPGPVKAAGLALALVAIILMNGGEKERRSTAVPLLFAVLAVGGAVELMAKLFSYYGDSSTQEYYVLYTFVFALALSVVLMLIKGRKIRRQDILAGFMVGLPNQLAALLLLKAVDRLPAYLVFPINGAAVILVVNVANYLLYKETLTKRQYLCTGLIGAALVLINI